MAGRVRTERRSDVEHPPAGISRQNDAIIGDLDFCSGITALIDGDIAAIVATIVDACPRTGTAPIFDSPFLTLNFCNQ